MKTFGDFLMVDIIEMVCVVHSHERINYGEVYKLVDGHESYSMYNLLSNGVPLSGGLLKSYFMTREEFRTKVIEELLS